MNSTHVRIVLLPLPLLLLAVLACGFPAQSQEYNPATATMQALGTRVAATEEALRLLIPSALTATPTPGEGQESVAVATLTPTSSATPTSTPCIPVVSVSQNTNCRSGPGTIYAYLGALMVGEQAEVVGQSSAPNYWVILNPDKPGQQCWLWGQYAEVICDTSGLPIITPPPTPTPTITPLPDWTGSWQTWNDSAFSVPSFMIYVNQTGLQLSGSFTVGASDYTFSATLDPDYMYAHGTWVRTNTPNWGSLFWWLKENRNQFYGSIGGNWGAWCGARNGASQPSPCGNY